MSATEPAWFKSTYSGGGGGNCIEVAVRTEAVLVRDSKDITRPALAVSPGAWSAFAAAVGGARG
ncbi:DUF397 domain-containing protein [Streptomyces sp. enrichment culture]|uniref:DUF397 domain-containing protein n=1 Tax=Streptomyces sp. enrichment culture TaxID=1795815 RepID=UPI003F56F51D